MTGKKRYLLVMYLREQFPESRYDGYDGTESFFAIEEFDVYDGEEDYIHNRIGAFIADFNGDYYLYTLGGEIDPERMKEINEAAMVRAKELWKLREDNARAKADKERQEAENRRVEAELKQLRELKEKYE